MTCTRDVLARCAGAGVQLWPDAGSLAYSMPADTSSDLKADLGAHRAELARLVVEAAVRHAWRIPNEVSIGPRVATILAWLVAERSAFGRDEWRLWLEAKTSHIDHGASSYLADILATEAVARTRLGPKIGCATDRAAA